MLIYLIDYSSPPLECKTHQHRDFCQFFVVISPVPRLMLTYSICSKKCAIIYILYHRLTNSVIITLGDEKRERIQSLMIHWVSLCDRHCVTLTCEIQKFMKRYQPVIYSGEGCVLHKGPWRRWARAEIHPVLMQPYAHGDCGPRGDGAVSNSHEGTVKSLVPRLCPPGISQP